jgi:Ca2+-transporting ATPase
VNATPTESLGLSEAEAQVRLARDGPNRLPKGPRRTFAVIAVGVALQPMFLLLLATAAVYGFVGSLADALSLLVSVGLVAAISVYQELRTERVLEALKDLASPRSRVLRGGVVRHVSSQELVRGDRLLVAEGDRLACDAQLLEAHGLAVDESLLTGESAPVPKRARSPGHSTGLDATPAGLCGTPAAPMERADLQTGGGNAGAPATLRGGEPPGTAPTTPPDALRAGTLVVSGDGVALVTATGAHTELGRIGKSLTTIEARPSRVQTELGQIVRGVAVAATLTCLAAAWLYGARQGSWTEGLLVGLTLAMSIIPEEFAVVWTVILALGAWRLSRHQVLTRQPQAIEALGTTRVLCVDKTGTLTHNRMELLALATPRDSAMLNPGAPADARFTELLAMATLASAADGLEPMDRAILRLRERSLAAGVSRKFAAGRDDEAAGATPAAAATAAGSAGMSARAAAGGAGANAREDADDTPPPPSALLHRQGVSPELPCVVHAWRMGDGPGLIAMKGAPETVIAQTRLGPAEATAVLRQAEELAAQGLRVLAVAHAEWDPALPLPAPLPPLGWDGLIGFQDPLREDVPEAVATCLRAGLRVVMITGDAPATAAAIARQAGLDAQQVVTGAALGTLDEAALEATVGAVSVFARVSPQQKLAIVRALQQRGEVVAMTGDGVNDAIALRAADIGVAMGRRGTDVARESAALVLLDDSFSALVAAVRLGRRIFVNLQRSVTYLLAVHLPIVTVSLIPVLFGGPVLLLPLHVVFLELIIDPACSLVFEAEAEPPDCMARPPRSAQVRLISRQGLMSALAAGALAALLVGAVQVLGHWGHWPAPWLRFAALSSLIAGNLAMLAWFLGRLPESLAAAGRPAARPPNRALLGLLTGLCLTYALVLLLAPLAQRFGLPEGPAVQAVGALLLVGAALSALRLHITRTRLARPGGPSETP